MRMPGTSARAERFARVLDDPAAAEAGTEVAELVAVVDRLRSIEDVELDPRVRTQLRNRLVTAAVDASVMRSAGGGVATDELARRRARWSRGRVGLVAALLVLVALASLTVVFSRGALPGDSLYGVKRASEDAELQFARGDEARGWKYLDLARTRAQEVGDLTGRQVNAPVFTSTLTVMDQQMTDGVRLLNGIAAGRADDALLVREQAWAVAQYGLLLDLVARLPASVQPDAVSSMLLLRQVVERVVLLRGSLSCDCLGTSGSDGLGPLPCVPCTARASGTPPPAAATTPNGPAAPTSSPTPGAPPASRPVPPRPTSAPPTATGGGGGPLPLPTGGGGNPLPSGGGGRPLPTSVPVPTVPVPTVPGLPLPTSIPLPTLPLPPLPTLLPTGGILPSGVLPGL
jgi:Domain of unknown function (DUF5667)